MEEKEREKELAKHGLGAAAQHVRRSKESSRLKKLVKSVQWVNKTKLLSSLTVDGSSVDAGKV